MIAILALTLLYFTFSFARIGVDEDVFMIKIIGANCSLTNCAFFGLEEEKVFQKEEIGPKHRVHKTVQPSSEQNYSFSNLPHFSGTYAW